MSEQELNKQLSLLIQLLDDPDLQVFQQVKDQIMSIGPKSVEKLEQAWFEVDDSLRRTRIEELVQSLQSKTVQNDLQEWVNSGGADLLKGFIIVTRFQYPNLDENKLLKALKKIIRSIWVEMNENHTSLEKIKILNHLLFGTFGFNCETVKNRSIDHFFLNNLLETKTGNIISLGILYLLIGERLELPLKGIDLPHNFICGFTHYPSEFSNDYKPLHEVKFFINPAMKGSIFTRKEIMLYLEKIDLQPEDKYFSPINHIQVLTNWITQLSAAFQQNGMEQKARDLENLADFLLN